MVQCSMENVLRQAKIPRKTLEINTTLLKLAKLLLIQLIKY